MLKFSDATPAWIRDWVKWTANLLVPEWDITVVIVDKLSELNKEEKSIYGDEIEAHSSPANDSMFTRIELLSSIEDNYDGHLLVVHEICHAFTSHMCQTAENLITSNAIRKTAWKSFAHAEEQSVVRLSRILVALREKSMLDYSESVKQG